MSKRAAGRVRWGSVWLLWVRMSVLVLEHFQLIAGLLQVEMAERTQMVFLNENVTIFCKIAGSAQLDIKSMGITWFQKTQKSETYTKLFEYFGNHREASQRGACVSLRSLEMGDASLQLPGVRLEDAGEYRCELVVTPQKAQGTVWLEVVESEKKTDWFYIGMGVLIIGLITAYFFYVFFLRKETLVCR
ncbi:hypothetical protein MJT46_010047 [Ovis ammon polii x Ovis aries]|nr:hypothetical protein MJT46_010047 [Ovis ammon polii x Ovis aries]